MVKDSSTDVNLAHEVDLTNCDREPIHILGRVQSYGALVAFSPDWVIEHASENTADLLGKPAKELIGIHLGRMITREAERMIAARLQVLNDAEAVERIFGVVLVPDGPAMDIALHRSGRHIFLEAEQSGADPSADLLGRVRPMIDRIGRAETVEQLCHLAARQVRGFTGFDKVMVYRFGPDGSGSVIAEAVKAGMPAYLGLRFPASDIPKQARALYTRNLLRIISDVDDAGFEIVSTADAASDRPLDLSLSSTRAVSPIHLEYLRNMGVKGSMSISILKRGKLWGLFACHHETPRTLTYAVRSAAELFAQLFSWLLEQKLSDQETQQRVAARRVHDMVMSKLVGDASVLSHFDAITESIGDVIPHDGAVGWVDGTFVSSGHAPTQAEFEQLLGMLGSTAEGRVFATDHIAEVFAAAQDHADRAAGLLALPVSRRPRDFLVLFRREMQQSVSWAGNPEKPVELGPNGIRLTPRESFKEWKQILRDRCAPWTDLEITTADELRVMLLEVVLRMADEALEERRRAQERQELLIAELNHRVRNILNLIRGLVKQSNTEARTASEITEIVGGRIHALARAHDQITKENWAPASLRELLTIECAAYLDSGRQRMVIEGEDVLLEPAAFSTFALVCHELVTNAAKYGALSAPAGCVRVNVSVLPGGDLELRWTEEGGPPIGSPPERRGFGSTIIERSVPYDLGGDAELHYAVTGFSGRFIIPTRFVTVVAPLEKPSAEAVPAVNASARSLLEDVLLLEDNMIIALDTEDMLLEVGAETVRVAGTLRDAGRLVDNALPSFAVLDVNLGLETSYPLAERLGSEGVPFAFATGYGETTELVQAFPEARILRKPYTKSDLEDLFKEKRES